MGKRQIGEVVIGHAQSDMSLDPAMSHGKDRKQGGLLREMFAAVIDSIKEGWENLHVGDEHAKGMAKLGLHELTQALPAFPDSNIRPLEEPGVFGNETMPHLGAPSFEQAMNDNYRPRDNDRSHSH